MADETQEPVVEAVVETPVETPAVEPRKPTLEEIYDVEPPPKETADPKVDTGDANSAEDDKDEQPDSDVQDTAPQIDAELLAQAAAWRISPEAARALGEAGLSREINRLWAQQAVRDSQYRQQQQVPATKQEEDALAKALKEIEEDPDGYDDKVKAVLKGMYSEIQQQRQVLQSTHQELAYRRQAEEEVQYRKETEEFDRLFTGIEAPELFGNGGYFDGKTTDEQMTNRFIVARQVKAAVDSYAEFGKKPPELSELFRRVVESQFPDKIQTQSQRTLAEQLESRKGQSLSRPTPRKAPPRTNEERAVAAVREKMREQGREMSADDDFVQF